MNMYMNPHFSDPRHCAAFERILNLWRKAEPEKLYLLKNRMMFEIGRREITAETVLRYFMACEVPLPERVNLQLVELDRVTTYGELAAALLDALYGIAEVRRYFAEDPEPLGVGARGHLGDDNEAVVARLHTMTPAQCQAARAVLTWSRLELADRSRVDVSSIKDFEWGSRLDAASMDRIQTVLEKAGIVFGKRSLRWPEDWTDYNDEVEEPLPHLGGEDETD
jgi:hypothetical protein